MNFIAIIGVIDSIINKNDDKYATLMIKVEKPFLENKDEEWYDIVDTKVNTTLFKNEIRLMEKGSIIGIKGRLERSNIGLQTIAERVQLF